MGGKGFFPLQIEQQVGIGQSMDHAEKKREKINHRKTAAGWIGSDHQVIQGRSGNGERDSKFYPGHGQLDNAENTQRQRNTMPDGKSSNQDGYLSPVFELVP